ncbi:Zinc Finger Mynd Domain-Containing Protein 15 [Manis pentadactyla]|nr:Zinc Finger Mynd Domain-Containing Protein 15 [Manis pentadactyla]
MELVVIGAGLAEDSVGNAVEGQGQIDVYGKGDGNITEPVHSLLVHCTLMLADYTLTAEIVDPLPLVLWGLHLLVREKASEVGPGPGLGTLVAGLTWYMCDCCAVAVRDEMGGRAGQN